jgi:hypothetical protein
MIGVVATHFGAYCLHALPVLVGAFMMNAGLE